MFISYKNGAVQTDANGDFLISTRKNKLTLRVKHGWEVGDTSKTIRTKHTATVLLYSAYTDPPLAENYQADPNNKSRFICGISEAPMEYTNEDRAFEKVHNIEYNIQGCTPMLPWNELVVMNRIVARRLDQLFGTGWRAKARKDIPGVTY